MSTPIGNACVIDLQDNETVKYHLHQNVIGPVRGLEVVEGSDHTSGTHLNHGIHTATWKKQRMFNKEKLLADEGDHGWCVPDGIKPEMCRNAVTICVAGGC